MYPEELGGTFCRRTSLARHDLIFDGRNVVVVVGVPYYTFLQLQDGAAAFRWPFLTTMSESEFTAIRDAVEVLESVGVDTSGLCLRRHLQDVLPMSGLAICHDATSSRPLHHRSLVDDPASFIAPDEKELFYTENIFGVIVSVGFVAVVAGLFLGLLTLDALDLQIIQRVSMDEDERRYAAKLFPIVKKRHHLLVTLLILNALAYECLPIFMDRLVPSWAAIILSTTLVLLFGEIVPLAVFTGPKQLMLGSAMVPLVNIFLCLLYPLAAPLAWLLDRIVYGTTDPKVQQQHMSAYDRAELAALVRIQYEDRIARKQRTAQNKKEHETNAKDASWSALKREILEKCLERESVAKSYSEDEVSRADYEVPMEQLRPPLHQTEVGLVVGALQMKTRVVMDVYTPLRLVYAVADSLVLDKDAICRIYSQGFSRIPVYRPNADDPNDHTAILGFLMTRQLMLIDWDHERLVSTVPLHRPVTVSPRMNLVDLLQLLRVGGSLMAFVCARPDLANKALSQQRPIPVEAGFMGIISLEDVMESILQDRIHDETDVRDRDRAVATLHRWAATKLQAFVRKKTKKARERRSFTVEPHASDSTPLLYDTENQPSNYTPQQQAMFRKDGLSNSFQYEELV